LIKREGNQADTHHGALSVGRHGYDCPMKPLQLAHLPLRTKLIATSALTASMALFIVAITQCVSSYFYEHNEAYDHLNAVAKVVAGRSVQAIESQSFEQASQLVSALRVEPSVEEALLVDQNRRVLMHYASSKTMLMASTGPDLTPLQRWQEDAIHSHQPAPRLDGPTALTH